jgi:hypothetical protein
MKTQGRQPTLVSLMTGMNNAINSAWVKGMPCEKTAAGYRLRLWFCDRLNMNNLSWIGGNAKDLRA